jgi:putative membrane protein
VTIEQETDMKTKWRKIALRSVVALVTLAALPAVLAQQGNPAGMTPSSQQPTPAPVPNPADRLFVLLVGQGGLAEVDLGRLAQAKAGSAAVKRFAQQMVDDHSKSHAELEKAARSANLAPPSQPSPDQQAARARLASLDGAAFDQAYLRVQLVEHQKTVQLLQWEMGSGQHAPLQHVAADALPTVLDHLATVQALISEPPPR